MRTSDLDDTPRQDATSLGHRVVEENFPLTLPDIDDACITSVAIIGNGPGRVLYDSLNEYDIVIGCNYPNSHTDVHYSAFVDAFAAKWMRRGADKHDQLGRFRLVLGERCVASLGNIKAQPASVDSLAERWAAEGRIAYTVKYPDEFAQENVGDGQKYFSSGHMAYFWAAQKYPNASFTMYGFDSVFTGDHLASYSNVDVRGYGELAYTKREIRNVPRDCAIVWHDMWNTLLSQYASPDAPVEFVGYEGDPELTLQNTLAVLYP